MEDPRGGIVNIDEYRRIRYEHPTEDVVAVVMDRPEMRNAQDARMLAELDHAFRRADRDKEVGCIVLEGDGPDFSSGHDLSMDWDDELSAAYAERRAENIGEQMRQEREFYFDHARRLRDVSTPTIASVHGNCVLGGLMLANVCDLVVASEDARFVNPSLRHGGTGAEVLWLPWLIGVRKTKELLWTGDPLYAPEAKDLGLVNRVAPDDEREAETLYLARRVALMPRISLEVTKESLNNVLAEMGQTEALKYHFALHQVVHYSEEVQDWHEEAENRQEEGGFGAWLKFRDGPFEELAAEFDRDDPRIM